jgi:shikimate dehydrogenase
MDFRHTLIGAVGLPIKENPTGVIMEAAFNRLGLNWRYELFEIGPASLKEALSAFKLLGFRGLNFTVPHKVAVMQYLDDVSPAARMIGAVNTVIREGDSFIGENTDGKGFIRSLRVDAGIQPKGLNVTIIGAGGAARAIAFELALAGTASITLANRTVDRAASLANDIEKSTRCQVTPQALGASDYIVPPATDILIQATSIGLHPDPGMPSVNFESISETMIICDVIPNRPQTPFLQRAALRGASTIDGLGMLVHQAAFAIEAWTGLTPPVHEMRSAVERVLNQRGDKD